LSKKRTQFVPVHVSKTMKWNELSTRYKTRGK